MNKHIKIENPAFDYDNFGQGYSVSRRTDPRIADYVHKALSDAKTILNVGAGSGSYEPHDNYVIAVEPSVTMRNQRIKNGKKPAINAKADNLPFDNDSFDASMAMVTVHPLRRICNSAFVYKASKESKIHGIQLNKFYIYL